MAAEVWEDSSADIDVRRRTIGDKKTSESENVSGKKGRSLAVQLKSRVMCLREVGMEEMLLENNWVILGMENQNSHAELMPRTVQKRYRSSTRTVSRSRYGRVHSVTGMI